MGVPKWLQSVANATIKASVADAPTVTTASGYTINSKTGEVTQDATDDPGVKQLRDNLAILGGTAAGITAAPVVGAVVSNPVTQKLIGDAAASMLGGEVVDKTHRALTGQSFGRGIASIFGQQNVYDRSALARFGYDALNPGYFAGNLVAKGTNAAIDAAGKALKNADNYVTIQNALRTGKLKFGEPTTYTGIHQSKTPLTKAQFPFQRWDVTTHGADPNGFWLTLADSPNTTGTMASRPYASRWSATSQKPLIQTGEVKGLLGKKNNTRNAIVKYGRKHGADAFEFRRIADNRLPQTDVIMVTEGTNPQYLGEFTERTYVSPKTSYKSLFMEEPIMGRGPGRPKKSSAEAPISPEAWDEMLFEDMIGEQGAINAARKASQAGKRVLKPITEAEKLGIPKSLRADPRALEDPYYWGYEQWNQRYNNALNKGDYQEVQRIRDLHFKTKAPDTKVIDENGNPLHMYHGMADRGPKQFQQYRGVNWDVEDAVENGDLRNHWKIAKPTGYVMANYHTPNYETAIKSYGRGKEYLVHDDYLNITKPFTYDREDLHNLINSKFPGSSEKILHIEREHYARKPLKGLDGKYLRDSNGKIIWGEQLIPERQYFEYTGVPDWSRFGWDGRKILMQQGYDGLFIPQYYDSYGAFVSPSQFKAADPITWNGKGEIIPIVKRDNFHNLDRRYKQGGKIKSIF